MEYVVLNNGIKMPKLGFGVYQIAKEDCEECVLNALKIGYRLIDTAQAYANEEEVGNALQKSDVSRSEIFLTTKVWIGNYGYEQTLKSVDESMQKLQVDYIDLVLLHQPFADYYGAYRALEELYEKGLIRSIGVSNFYPDRLNDISAFNKIVPQINQVETNPFNQQVLAQANMLKQNVQIEAWAPFGEGRNKMFFEPTLLKIAKSHNKSVAQIILRWLTQRNVVALAKSTHVERIRENFEIFDFCLSDHDMAVIQKLDQKKSLFFDHQSSEGVDFIIELVQKRAQKKED